MDQTALTSLISNHFKTKILNPILHISSTPHRKYHIFAERRLKIPSKSHNIREREVNICDILEFLALFADFAWPGYDLGLAAVGYGGEPVQGVGPLGVVLGLGWGWENDEEEEEEDW